MSTTAQDHNAVIKQNFSELFGIFEENLNGKSKLNAHTKRKEAMTKFEAAPFPTRKDENWKYTSVARMIEPRYELGIPFQLTKDQLEQYPLAQLDAYTLVFLNGVFQSDLSNLPDATEAGINVVTLDQAHQDAETSSVIDKLSEQSASDAMHTFAALNEAFSRHGFLIYVRKNVIQEKPIHFLYLTETENQILLSPRLLVHVEGNSECTIIESYVGTEGQSYFVNGTNNINVGANSHLHHYKVQLDSNKAFRINDTVVTQQRDSTYSNYTIDLGAKIVRNNLSAILKDSGTMTNFLGLYLPKDDQHVDNQTFIDHAFPHCNSNELYKGVIRDKGRGVFNGKVLVRQDAQKTNAYQQNSTLVLSKQGVMDTKPQLEIFADDVRCSHGATVGQLDEDSVYYLKARGLNDAQSRALLQYAFVGEVIEELPYEPLKELIAELVRAKLNA